MKKTAVYENFYYEVFRPTIEYFNAERTMTAVGIIGALALFAWPFL